MTNTAPHERTRLGDLLRLTGFALAGAVVLLAAGWLPTRRLGGEPAVWGMLVGVGISMFASVAAAFPIACIRSDRPQDRQLAALGAMAVRLFATLVLFAAAALGQWVERRPLAIWTGIGYLYFLSIETTLFVLMIRGRQSGR